MVDHIRRLGILTAVTGVVSGVTGILFLFILDRSLLLNEYVPAVVMYIWMGFMALLAIPYLVTAIGLIGMKSWSRSVGLIVLTFGLINIPLGSALGLYGLWVLMSPEADALFSPRFNS